MKSSRLRSFSSIGKMSRSAVIGGVALAALSAVTAVVVARAGTVDARASAADAGRRVLGAAEAWQSESPEGCPSITELMEAGYLDSDARTDDSWGNRFRIVCAGGHLVVRSAGPDGRAGTPDDLSVGRDPG